MKTELLYLDDTYLFTEKAAFLEMREHVKGQAIILDRTIFYPQGGGQPSDTGYIRNEQGVFRVDFVGLDEEGVVYHVGEFESGYFAGGSSVQLLINEEKRRLHARIHSGGHLLDVAVAALKVPLVATKGFHFPDGPYVEYSGAVENLESFKSALEEQVKVLVEKNIPVECTHLTQEDARARGLHAPAGKSVRVINFSGDAGCGCGGTHVQTSRDIGAMTIRKISSKNGVVRISYAVSS